MLQLNDMFKIDCKEEVFKISEFLKEQVFLNYKRDGIVVGMSGGVDSGLTTALSVAAIGKENVLGLIIPEKESDPNSRKYAEKLAKKMGIRYEVFDITKVLESFDIYNKRDAAIRKIFPDYIASSKFKIYLQQDLKKRAMINFFYIDVDLPSGRKTERLSKEAYLAIIAASHVKLRTRMVTLYYFAQLNNYLVGGTSNRTEIGLGDVCKYGDGGVDAEPIAHLYKTQIRYLAEYSGVPEEIVHRKATPDMFSMPVTSEEWYFGLVFEELDPLLYAYEHNMPKKEIAKTLNLTEEEVGNIFINFTNKRKVTRDVFSLIPRME